MTLPNIVVRKQAAPSEIYTVIGELTSDAAQAVLFSPAPTYRPHAVGTRPEVYYEGGWDGGAVTLTGRAPDGTIQTEVIAAGDGGAVAARYHYAVITSVTAAGSGSGSYLASIRCSEGWHIQLPHTAGVRANAAVTLVQTLESGDTVTETYAAGDVCYGDIACISATSTSASIVAYGTAQ